jgi:hypothetical protein
MKASAKNRLVTLVFGSALAAVVGIAGDAHAACTTAGTVVTSVAESTQQCNGMVSFATNNSGSFLICTANAEQGRIVTAAYLSGKPIRYQLGGGDNDCNPGSGEDETRTTIWVHAL